MSAGGWGAADTPLPAAATPRGAASAAGGGAGGLAGKMGSVKFDVGASPALTPSWKSTRCGHGIWQFAVAAWVRDSPYCSMSCCVANMQFMGRNLSFHGSLSKCAPHILCACSWSKAAVPGRGGKGEVRERSPDLRPEPEHMLGPEFDEQVCRFGRGWPGGEGWADYIRGRRSVEGLQAHGGGPRWVRETGDVRHSKYQGQILGSGRSRWADLITGLGEIDGLMQGVKEGLGHQRREYDLDEQRGTELGVAGGWRTGLQ